MLVRVGAASKLEAENNALRQLVKGGKDVGQGQHALAKEHWARARRTTIILDMDIDSLVAQSLGWRRWGLGCAGDSCQCQCWCAGLGCQFCCKMWVTSAKVPPGVLAKFSRAIWMPNEPARSTASRAFAHPFASSSRRCCAWKDAQQRRTQSAAVPHILQQQLMGCLILVKECAKGRIGHKQA